MIGGKVLQVTNEGQQTMLWCLNGNDETAIRVVTEPDMPQPGDDVWWQMDGAYWTPADRRFQDKKLKRIGYSFDPLNTEPL